MSQKLLYKELKYFYPEAVQIVDGQLDCSKDVCYITINEDTTLELVNKTLGQTVTVIVTNDASTVKKVEFEGVKINLNDFASSMLPGATNVYLVSQKDATPYVSLISANAVVPFLTGELGDLVIASNQTVTIPAGGFYDYRSITIDTGGILYIDDSTNQADLTELYSESMLINGQIIGRSLQPLSAVTKTAITAMNTAFQITYTLTTGASGGKGGNATGYGTGYGGAGGTSTSGSKFSGGGGGGGYTKYDTWSADYRMNGAAGGSNGGNGGAAYGSVGGDGGNLWANSATNDNGASGGSGGGGGPDHDANSGGGGGGGYRNSYGLPLYLFCYTEIKGTGLIDLSGVAGISGGRGANATTASDCDNGGGGGGGGGAGGGGGHLKVSAPGFVVAYTVAGGSGGAGGGGGTRGGYDSVNGSSGGTGYTGAAGTFALL